MHPTNQAKDRFHSLNVYELYAFGSDWKVRWTQESFANVTTQPRFC